MSDLGTLDGQESTALLLNEVGQVVGKSGTRGFFYSQGKKVEWTAMLPQGSGWKSAAPRCINDRGQIASVGIFSDGKLHVFLMTPTP